MPYTLPTTSYYPLHTNPADRAYLLSDYTEMFRRQDFNKRWGLPIFAQVSENIVRSSSILIQEAHHLLQHYPVERLLFITLTFRSLKQSRHASTLFNSINCNVLGNFVSDWIKVVDVTEKGSNHIHALVVAKEDVLTGTELCAVKNYYDRNLIENLPWSRRRILRNETSTNMYLHQIWETLDSALTNYGFGWVYDAFPLITPTSIPPYLRRAFLRARLYDSDHGVKNCRRVSYSRKLIRKFPGGIIPRSQRSIRNEAALLEACGLNHRREFLRLIGRRWGYVLLKCLPKDLHFKEPLDILTPPDLARRILTLCNRDQYYASKLELLISNLDRVASGHSCRSLTWVSGGI